METTTQLTTSTLTTGNGTNIANRIFTEREIRLAFKNRVRPNTTPEQNQLWADIINSATDRELIKRVIDYVYSIEKRMTTIKNSFRFQTKIRPFVNRHGYSDVYPYEVIRVISEQTVEIRQMKSELASAPVCLGVGGFSAVFENYSQRWTIESDPTATVIRIRKGKKGWNNGQFRMSDDPCKFYDYNF